MLPPELKTLFAATTDEPELSEEERGDMYAALMRRVATSSVPPAAAVNASDASDGWDGSGTHPARERSMTAARVGGRRLMMVMAAAAVAIAAGVGMVAWSGALKVVRGDVPVSRGRTASPVAATPTGAIDMPTDGASVPAGWFALSGQLDDQNVRHAGIVKRVGMSLWPQCPFALHPSEGRWAQQIGQPSAAPNLVLMLVDVDEDTNTRIQAWCDQGRRTGKYLALDWPDPDRLFVIDQVTVHVTNSD